MRDKDKDKWGKKMARDYIKIDTTVSTATKAQGLKDTVEGFRRYYEALKKNKAIMDHNTDGANYADIEALYGLPAGKGDDVYNLVSGAVSAIEGGSQTADGKTLTEQVG